MDGLGGTSFYKSLPAWIFMYPIHFAILLILLGAFGQPTRGGRKVAHDDAMERTYDLLWHDLIQHREGKGKSTALLYRAGTK